jgi:ferredoxin-NADP reductase
MAILGESSAMPATDAAAVAVGRLHWRTAEVTELVEETPRVRSLTLSVPDWPGHVPGQHVDIRLTGDDGYQARRSYSVASAPEADRLTLTVERIEGGEVSPYLAGDVRPGDRFELRGPIGGYFAWTTALGGPLWLIAGGSGIAPLMSMLRHRAAATVPARLIYSSRTFADIIYRDEIDRLAARGDGLEVVHTLTRQQPAGWTGGTRRIDQAMLANTGFPPQARPHIFICGPTPLVEAAARFVLALGHKRGLIKTERFGPTGGPR